MMFKHFTINLTKPICECENQNLYWRLRTTEKRTIVLNVCCNTCKAFIQVPYKDMEANFSLDENYPNQMDYKESFEKNVNTFIFSNEAH